MNIDSLYLNSAYRRPDISSAGIGRDNEKRNGGDRANRLWIATEREKRLPGNEPVLGKGGEPPSQEQKGNASEWNL